MKKEEMLSHDLKKVFLLLQSIEPMVSLLWRCHGGGGDGDVWMPSRHGRWSHKEKYYHKWSWQRKNILMRSLRSSLAQSVELLRTWSWEEEQERSPRSNHWTTILYPTDRLCRERRILLSHDTSTRNRSLRSDENAAFTLGPTLRKDPSRWGLILHFILVLVYNNPAP